MPAIVELEGEWPFAVQIDRQVDPPPVVVFERNGRAAPIEDEAVVGERRWGEGCALFLRHVAHRVDAFAFVLGILVPLRERQPKPRSDLAQVGIMVDDSVLRILEDRTVEAAAATVIPKLDCRTPRRPDAPDIEP